MCIRDSFNLEPVCETEVEDENDKLVSLLEKVPGCDNVNAKDLSLIHISISV